ncbi:unnamed protein product [Prorocentrum cordatum]|uniref:Uncharacterized protein n=1 Tax=Prorocentrum cordatum TaxID=2364126 RepID=A0ABN9QTH7_9DINO|nr:unnamed protein product [Polarella glacialis]
MVYHELEENFWTPTAMLVSDMEANELVTYGEGLRNELLRILVATAVDPEHPQVTEPIEVEGDDGDDFKKPADEQVVQFAAERAAEPPNQEAIEASEAIQEDPVQIEQAALEKPHDGFSSQAEVQEQFLGTEPYDEATPHDDATEVISEVDWKQFGTTSWKYRAGENWLSVGNQSAEIEKAAV